MDSPAVNPTVAGRAFRVTILGGQQNEAYEHVYALLDDRHPVVHLFDGEARTHFLTIPLACALIEWQDPVVLEPQPRIPPYGAGAFERLGEQMQRMATGMTRAFGGPQD